MLLLRQLFDKSYTSGKQGSVVDIVKMCLFFYYRNAILCIAEFSVQKSQLVLCCFADVSADAVTKQYAESSCKHCSRAPHYMELQ